MCPVFSVLAAATFSPRTRETPDLLSCCKKLFPLDRRLLSSSRKQQKLAVCRKGIFQNASARMVPALGYLKASYDRASQDF